MWKARGTHSGDYRAGARSEMTIALYSHFHVPCTLYAHAPGEVDPLLFVGWSLEISTLESARLVLVFLLLESILGLFHDLISGYGTVYSQREKIK